MGFTSFSRQSDRLKHVFDRAVDSLSRMGALFAFGRHVAFENSIFALRDIFRDFSSGFARYGKIVAGEAHLLEDGIMHMGSAPFSVRDAFARDARNCAVETGLACSEAVSIEMAMVVATAQSAEKVLASADHYVPPKDLIMEFSQSVCSSAISAVHAGMNMVHDIEESGHAWQADHRRVFTALPC